MSTVSIPADEARSELGGTFAGQLVGPRDAEYDEARKLFNAMIDKRPALVARCASTADVAAAIGFARRHDLPLAVCGGGHNGGGLGSVDDGVMANLSLLNEHHGRPRNPHRQGRRGLHVGRGRRRHARARPRRARAGSSRRRASGGSPSAAASAT